MESIAPSLFRTLNESNKKKITNNYTIEVSKGRGMWRQLDHVIFFDEPHRAKDKVFSRIKRRLRNGCIQKEDISILNSRCVQQCTSTDAKRFVDAPFYTTRHYEIDYVNERRIHFYSIKHNKQLIKWKTPIIINGKTISTKSWIYQMLYHERFSLTQKKLKKIGREFFYCEGVAYKILVTPKHGGNTGTVTSNIGIMVGLQLDEREIDSKNRFSLIRELLYPPKVVFLKLRKHTLGKKLSGLENFPIGTVPIFPGYESVTLDLTSINEKWLHMYNASEYSIPSKLKIKLFGYKLAPAFANTDYGCQGCTHDSVITNMIPGPYSKKKSSTSAYVIISRAKSLNGVLLSHPITSECLLNNPHADLIRETYRLRCLERETLVGKSYLILNLIAEVEDIRRRLESLQSRRKKEIMWVQNKIKYLLNLIESLSKLLVVPDKVKTCVSCLEICLSDEDKPRCFECEKDNIPHLKQQTCFCGKKMSWVSENDGITRNEQYCVSCSKKNKQPPKTDITVNRKRNRCMNCNNYTTTPLSKFCYKCDPRLQNIKYVKNSVEKCHPNMTTNKHLNILKLDRIHEKLEPKKSSQKHFCHKKHFSEVVHIRNEETVKINSSFGNLENALMKIEKPKNRVIKCHTNNNKIAMSKFPFAKLKNPGINLCFLNSAIQLILSIQPIADLLVQQHVKNNRTERCLSHEYVTKYYSQIPFLYEFEALAVSMLKNPSKSFLADTLAYNFQELGICNYIFGEQWDSSEIIDTFFTFYEKFINALQPCTFKSDVLKTLSSIKTKVQQIRKCNKCGDESVQEEPQIFHSVSLEKKVENIFDADYGFSPEFKCEKCNSEVRNIDGSLITGAKLISKISSISSYMIVKFGRIMMNGVDKNLQKITIPKTNDITVITNSNSVVKTTLNLESWIEHNGSSIYSGHYTHFRRYKSGFLTMSDDLFTFSEKTHVSNSPLCYLALLKRV